MIFGRSLSVMFMMFILLTTSLTVTAKQLFDEKSAYHQHLPDCSKGYTSITKRTSSKAILCPMIRDEEGFLSEWIGYYTMHGFDHVMIFDDGSSDNFMAELKPWIDRGIVSVRSNWTASSLRMSSGLRKAPYEKAMNMKALLEKDCKLQAIEWGYDYMYSLDLDEYVIPAHPGVTIVDEIEAARLKTNRSMYCTMKHNYVSTPHTLEPIDLLTIEAYQHRHGTPAKFGYYRTVSPKCAYVLSQPSQALADYVTYCCFFHGCDGVDRSADKPNFCYNQILIGVADKIKKGNRTSRGQSRYNLGAINHYARSLEKYALKSKTWRTASGEGDEKASTNYDIAGFLQRSIGWFRDPVALRYSCQLRDVLRNITGEENYLRPGSFWYKNPEFGRHINDPDKRGRYGRPNREGFTYRDGNPYHYHGTVQKETHMQYVPPPVTSVNGK